MSLLFTVSGVRGTVGGSIGQNLTPIDVVKYVSAFGRWLQQQSDIRTVVVGRDGRITSPPIKRLVTNTLQMLGYNVIDIGLTTTPTLAMYVPEAPAAGGIMVSASHNPEEWNALKFFNLLGELISEENVEEIKELFEDIGRLEFPSWEKVGTYFRERQALSHHINKILELPYVNTRAIRRANFRVVVDGINSGGAIAIPELLKQLGVSKVIVLNGDPEEPFAHNPEPLPANLTKLGEAVVEQGADLGIAVDPDGDRLVFFTEKGTCFGEEYTIVAVADYLLKRRPGPVVGNLSTTMALRKVAEHYKQDYYETKVGEVWVVKKMKETGAVIGGEGNGGVIYPDLHYGRDALVGIALFLSYLAEENVKASHLRKRYPDFSIVKTTIPLPSGLAVHQILERVREKPPLPNPQVNTEDGVKLTYEKGWVHIRTSNTEPILRIYAEGPSEQDARFLIQKVQQTIQPYL